MTNTINVRDGSSGTRTLQIPNVGCTLREVLNHNSYQYGENTTFYLHTAAAGNTPARLDDVAVVGGSYQAMVPTKAG